MRKCNAVSLCLFLSISLGLSAPKQNPVPDFTKGDAPFEDASFNVGPTGLRGWCYRKGTDTSLGLQILVKSVATNSPAHGILIVGDVILGCSGDGSTPKPFTTDARRTIADAITEAEARNPANLSLLRWRGGNISKVTLELESMGAYAPTAPYNCEKSRRILKKALQAVLKEDQPGSSSLGALVFLAANDPIDPNNDMYQQKAQEWVRKLILSPVEIQELKSDRTPGSGKVAWSHSYKLIVLAEYYLQTRDEAVFPTLEAYAICYAKNQSWFGTTGHQYAQKRPDGGNNGGMSGYGAINGSGVAGFYGMVLAREAGIKSSILDEAIHRSECFFASFAGKSPIPYGEHSYSPNFEMYDMNGKHATAALAFMFQKNRTKETKFYGKMTMASGKDRQDGHAGPFFNYVWPSLGAAAVGELPAVYYFRDTRWLFELSREWDGGVAFDHFGHGDIYRNFPAALTTLLTYALPLRQIYMTGRGHDRSRWLNKQEIRDVIDSLRFDPGSASARQLMENLSDWAPLVRYKAAEELAARMKDNENKAKFLLSLHQRLRDPSVDPFTRNAFCLVLEKIQDASSVEILADVLSDDNSYVCFGAAKALRQYPRDQVVPHINKILAAASSKKRPIFPINDDDPLQLAHAQISTLLFYAGNAYGPRGILSDDLGGIDRTYLWPAVRAVADTPTGFARSNVGSVYKQLTEEETFAVADAIVASVRRYAPADSMFATGVLKQGMELLQRYNIAEGVPLCAEIHPRGSADAIKVLERYGHAALTSDASDKVIEFLYDEMMVKGADIAGVISNMMNDVESHALKPLKKIESLTASPAVLALPDDTTELRVRAINYALPNPEDTKYTWRKVYGAGEVTFTPNASPDSINTTVKFTGGKAGLYRFEVTMSDKYGYTELKKTVDVTLNSRWRKALPSNKPPKADSLSVNAQYGVPLKLMLRGSDPDDDDLGFKVTQKPTHGKLSGTVPNLVYTADLGYTGADKILFDVIDGQGVRSQGVVTIQVDPARVATSVYEGFDYAPGAFEGLDGSTSVGLLGDWNIRADQYDIAQGSGTYPGLPSTGNMIYPINGHNRPVASRKIAPAVLERDRLLEAGGELWFSFAMSLTKKKMDRANSGIQFGLRAGDDAARASVGAQLSRNMMNAVINGEMGDSRMNQYKGETIMPPLVPHVFVGHCAWGVSDIDMDVVEIYRIVDVPGRGPVFLKEPISTFAGIVPQQEIDTLYFKSKDAYSMDEFRVGPTLQSVMLGTVAFE